jgi:hypothetical protein
MVVARDRQHLPGARGFVALMFVVGAAPALLILFVRLAVPESKPWRRGARSTAAPAELFAGKPVASTCSRSRSRPIRWSVRGPSRSGPCRPGRPADRRRAPGLGEVAMLRPPARWSALAAPLVGACIGRRPAPLVRRFAGGDGILFTSTRTTR